MAGPACCAFGIDRRGPRGAVRPTVRRPASGDRRATCSASDAARIREPERWNGSFDEHRAGWDATFSAPKSVSLTALVGGDKRIREAHRKSVTVALNEMERYVQGADRRQHPSTDDGCVGCRKIRARQQSTRRRVRRHRSFIPMRSSSISPKRQAEIYGRYNRRSFTKRSSTRQRFIDRVGGTFAGNGLRD